MPEGTLAVVIRIITAAETLRAKGAEPDRALAIVLRECDLPPAVEAATRAIWSAGGEAAITKLDRILACAARMCTVGVEPSKAIDVLHQISLPPDLVAVARIAWADAVERGAVVRRPHPPTVADWVALADALIPIGVDPSALLEAIERPPGFADVVRAAWTFASSNRSY